jgi:TIR domain
MATDPPPRPLIFISYSHLDPVQKDHLLGHLKVLEAQAQIEAWSDSRIEVGDDWETKIQEAMARASIAVLLISYNFLTSEYIMTKEVPVLLERRQRDGLRLIPVIVEACAWDTVGWLKDIQVYPGGKKSLAELPKPRRERALANFTKKMAELVKLAGPTPTSAGSIPIHPRVNISRLPSTSSILFGRDEVL